MKFTIPANAPAKPFHKHWQFCVGSGHAAMAMRTDYCEQLKQIHDELGIERVRFHGIFSDDMHTYDTMSTVMPMPGSEQVPFYEALCGVELHAQPDGQAPDTRHLLLETMHCPAEG